MIKTGYLIVLLVAFCTCKSWAQHTIVPSWGGGADQNELSFGFTFQYIESDFKIVKDKNWRNSFPDPQNPKSIVTPSLNAIRSFGTPGFGIGFITRYRLSDHLEIRTTPELIFADKVVRYEYTGQNIEKQVQTTSVDVPLSFKLKSDRIGDFRLYLLGGAKVSAAINKRPDDRDVPLLDRQLRISRNYAAYEAGIGCDIYFEYFKLSPEIKLSNSFGNVLMKEQTPFATPLSKLFLRTISFSLYFE
jgi:hypothetical protein